VLIHLAKGMNFAINGIQKPDAYPVRRSPMAALAQAICQVAGIRVDVKSLEGTLVFSVLILIVSLVALGTYGLDLSAAFF